jgi:hypothetical protein
MLAIESGKARAFTGTATTGLPDMRPSSSRLALSLACRSALIDREIVVEDTNGGSDFERANGALPSGAIRGQLF